MVADEKLMRRNEGRNIYEAIYRTLQCFQLFFFWFHCVHLSLTLTLARHARRLTTIAPLNFVPFFYQCLLIAFSIRNSQRSEVFLNVIGALESRLKASIVCLSDECVLWWMCTYAIVDLIWMLCTNSNGSINFSRYSYNLCEQHIGSTTLSPNVLSSGAGFVGRNIQSNQST